MRANVRAMPNDKTHPTDPTYVSISRAKHEFGGASRSYIYKLISQKLIRSVNPGGRRRLVELASIHALLERGDKGVAGRG